MLLSGGIYTSKANLGRSTDKCEWIEVPDRLVSEQDKSLREIFDLEVVRYVHEI